MQASKHTYKAIVQLQHPGPLQSLLVVMGNFSLVKATIAGVKACPSEIYKSWLIFCTIVWSSLV